MSNENVRGLVEELRRYRQADKDKKAIGGCLAAVGKFVFYVVVHVWWLPFAAMLGLGILHSYVRAVPALGFWETLVVGIGLRWIVGAARSVPAKKDKDGTSGDAGA